MRSAQWIGTALAAVVATFGVVAPVGAAPALGYQFAEGVEYEVLSTDAKDPLFIQVADDGRIFWVEREGRIQVLHPDGTQDDVGFLEVSGNLCNEEWCPDSETRALEEGGLYSILLAPDFLESGEIYLYRTVPGSLVAGDAAEVPRNQWRDTAVCFEPTCDVADNHGVWRLSRFTLDADSHLVPGSEVPLFEVPVYWLACCHYGGNLEWLADGTILLSTGDDMSANVGAYGQSTGHMQGNSEQSAMNPSDRRGKTLRMTTDGKVPDGSVPGVAANPYLVLDADGVAVRDAAGQLVTQEAEHTTIEDTWGADDGMVAYDPYVYSLGYKQPFRGTIHPYSGVAVFGEVGPDGFVPVPGRGPRGYEELNIIPAGGGVNHGWGRCGGNNESYYPWRPVDGAPSAPLVGGASTSVLEPYDCSSMEPAVLWYPHDVSEMWPSLGAGGVTSAPATFYRADTEGPLRLPASFDDHLIFMEESRSGVIAMPMTAEGELITDEGQWLFVQAPTGSSASALTGDAGMGIRRPIDAVVGPDGAVYIVEYGDGFYNGNNARITRLKCAGCTDDLSVALGNVVIAQDIAFADAARGGRGMAPVAVPAALVLAGVVLLVARRRRAVI